MKRISSLVILLCLCSFFSYADTFSTCELKVGDPFIYPDVKSGWYYLYASCSSEGRGGVAAYKSRDLKTWEGPVRVMTVPEDNWITGTIWAPEMHFWKGRYYLFATVNSSIRWKKDREEWPAYTYRATQTFVANSPEGPFEPVDKYGPIPPMSDMTLDGTLWVEDGIPYMVYCHEWVQITDGTMEYVPMDRKLSKAVAEPRIMFRASTAAWSTGDKDMYGVHYVTDGPFLYRSCTGDLLMIWSSYSEGRYAVGVSRSVTGRLSGPWIQEDKPLNAESGGHAMIFKDFDGKLYIVYHIQDPGVSRFPVIYELIDKGTTLEKGEQL